MFLSCLVTWHFFANVGLSFLSFFGHLLSCVVICFLMLFFLETFLSLSLFPFPFPSLPFQIGDRCMFGYLFLVFKHLHHILLQYQTSSVVMDFCQVLEFPLDHWKFQRIGGNFPGSTPKLEKSSLEGCSHPNQDAHLGALEYSLSHQSSNIR